MFEPQPTRLLRGRGTLALTVLRWLGARSPKSQENAILWATAIVPAVALLALGIAAVVR